MVRRARAIRGGLVAEWIAGPIFSSVLLEGNLFVAKVTTDFCMTEYVNELVSSVLFIQNVGISDRLEHTHPGVHKAAHNSMVFNFRV